MEQSNELAAMMQKMLADNAAAANNVVAVAQTERDKAAAERAAARKALLDTQKNTDALAKDFFKEHHARIEKSLRASITRELAERLLQAGESIASVAALLDVSDLFLADVARSVGYFKIPLTGSDTTIFARALYENQGRGGYFTLHWAAQTCRFWFEIAAHPAMLLIEIPRAEQWEAQTNIPLDQRRQVLQFMGERMVADQAPGHSYRIEVDSVVID